eukprot:TRINITY_DN5789_c0_g2_i2.p1 TRINITY_DN5789_c0_g2~~TRINITY_DN5789_c0_g2_i2.p1  ORF type:complete len:271 (+),score=40.59 TRINITY_DN5789_c0_g2_i2:79-891(+)
MGCFGRVANCCLNPKWYHITIVVALVAVVYQVVAPIGTADEPAWFKRGFAWLMCRMASNPPAQFVQLKSRLFSELKAGDYVLEVGAGTGANFAYLPQGVPLKWVGIEPNPYMHRYIHEAASRYPHIETSLHEGVGEKLDFASDTFDAVIVTHVLCSVEDQYRVLREIYRVLKPGKRFYFFEHVGANNGTLQRSMQDMVHPVWHKVAGGCHTNRETWSPIYEVWGRSNLRLAHFDAQLPVPFLIPHLLGYAVKPDPQNPHAPLDSDPHFHQ